MKITNTASLRKARQEAARAAEDPTAARASEDGLARKPRWTSPSSDTTVCDV